MAINAFEILAHGLNLHREQITSGEDVLTLVERCNEVMTVDVDDLYQRKVKPLYSAILEYSIKAEQKMEAEQLEALIHLRKANRLIVNSIKYMKDMQHNIDRFMCDDNEHIRREYNLIRANLALLLQDLFTFKTDQAPSVTLEKLDSFRAAMEESDIIANGTLDKLIRKRLITPDMATSLMNDSAHAYDIQYNLIDAARIILGSTYSFEEEAELLPEESEEVIRRREAFLDRIREEDAKIDRRVGHTIKQGDPHA